MKISASILLTVAGAALLGSCTTGQAKEVQNPKAQKELADALAGHVPGKPVNCIPNYRTNNMQVIDDSTLLFQDGRTIYLQKPQGACYGLANHSRTLVTRQFGTNNLCAGDINRLVDLSIGAQAGACVFGPFVPYTKPK